MGWTMTGTDIATLPATELAAMIRAKQVSPVELMSAVLDRIARLEPVINAFAYLDADRAMAGARAAEAALMGGGPIGALHGLPVSGSLRLAPLSLARPPHPNSAGVA
jgi:Asp-tRNA(Asn)/Glu-tRNA(Gln) amidotransferase A subunit family amidase